MHSEMDLNKSDSKSSDSKSDAKPEVVPKIPRQKSGTIPFGYKRGMHGYIQDQKSAKIVRAFFEHFLLHGCLRESVRTINERFYTRIAVGTGRYWLTNPFYRGDLVFKNNQGNQYLRDVHKPIISRQEAAQIDRLLARNKPLSPRSASAKRALAGLVQCQTCQHQLTISSVRPKGKRSPTKDLNKSDSVKSELNKGTKSLSRTEYCYLRCHQCPQYPKCSGIDYDLVFRQVITTICTELPKAVQELGEMPPKDLYGSITKEIERCEMTKTQVYDLLHQGILDQESANLRLINLNHQISGLRDKMAQLPPTDLPTIFRNITLPQFWADLSESERRFYLREFLTMITVPCDDDSGRLRELRLHFRFGRRTQRNTDAPPISEDSHNGMTYSS